MTGLVTGLSILVVLLVAALVSKTKGGYGVSTPSKEETPEEEAFQMSQSEKERLLRLYGTGTKPFKFSDDIEGTLTDLVVDYVNVYGTRYSSIKDALEKSTVISEDDRYEMALTDAQLAVLRKERISAKRHYHVEPTVFDGDVYIYKPCTIGITTITGINANKAPRIAIKIEKSQEGFMGISKIYLASSDIASASSFYEFNMEIDSDIEKFKALVVLDEKQYSSEVKEINEIVGRLDKYNDIISEGRLEIKGGKFIIQAPTDEQMKKRKAKESSENLSTVFEEEQPEEEAVKEVTNMFEGMVSSQE